MHFRADDARERSSDEAWALQWQESAAARGDVTVLKCVALGEDGVIVLVRFDHPETGVTQWRSVRFTLDAEAPHKLRALGIAMERPLEE